MTQRLKSTLKASAAILFAFALLFTSVMPALAAPPEDIPDTTAAVTKILEVPAGTAIPAVTFEFEAELQGRTDGPATLTIPDITMSSTDTGSTANNVTTVKKQTADFIASSITDPNTAFTGGAGKYVYKITESLADYTTVADITPYTYESKAEYEIHIYVEADDDDNLFIAYVVAWRTVDDMGDNIADVKVDPSPGDGTNTFSHMDFTNNYVKAESPDTPDPDPTTYDLFHISKTIAAYDEDDPDDTYFPFSVTVVNPAFPIADGDTGGLPEYYKAYVMVWNTTESKYVVVNGDTSVGTKGGTDNYGDYYTFQVGISKTIYLQHGQRLVFPTTPVGATWTTAELLSSDSGKYSDYTAKADVTTAGNTTVPYYTAPKGETLTVSAPVGEGANSADFTNTEDPVLPMGISVSNLPYIGLILLALVSLAAYVALKARQRRRAAAEAVYFD